MKSITINNDDNCLILENKECLNNLYDNGNNNNIETIKKLSKFMFESGKKCQETILNSEELTNDNSEDFINNKTISKFTVKSYHSSLNSSYVSNLEIMVDNLNDNSIEDEFIENNFNDDFNVFDDYQNYDKFCSLELLDNDNKNNNNLIIHEYYSDEENECEQFEL